VTTAFDAAWAAHTAKRDEYMNHRRDCHWPECRSGTNMCAAGGKLYDETRATSRAARAISALREAAEGSVGKGKAPNPNPVGGKL
jgi:hypothetical protein